MKSVHLVVLISCWWLAACIESNPQPMPIGGGDAVGAADTMVADAAGTEEVLLADGGTPTDVPADLVPVDVVEVQDAEAEVTDADGEVSDDEVLPKDMHAEDAGLDIQGGDCGDCGDLLVGIEDPGPYG